MKYGVKHTRCITVKVHISHAEPIVTLNHKPDSTSPNKLMDDFRASTISKFGNIFMLLTACRISRCKTSGFVLISSSAKLYYFIQNIKC